MEPRALLDALRVAERLKDETRHCYTSRGRRESVAEHSWRMALMAYWMKDAFPEADMDKVVRMCILHDLGECFSGDVFTFEKTQADEDREATGLFRWLAALPENVAADMRALFDEMAARETAEAKILKCIDGLEALIQHNESDLSTWIPKEREMNLTYTDDRVAFSPYLTALREEIRKDTIRKLAEADKPL